MEIPEENRNRLSNSIPKTDLLNQSISKSTIDSLTNEIQETLGDPSIEPFLIEKALKHIGEAKIRSILNYTLSHSHTPGHAFVVICSKEINKRLPLPDPTTP